RYSPHLSIDRLLESHADAVRPDAGSQLPIVDNSAVGPSDPKIRRLSRRRFSVFLGPPVAMVARLRMIQLQAPKPCLQRFVEGVEKAVNVRFERPLHFVHDRLVTRVKPGGVAKFRKPAAHLTSCRRSCNAACCSVFMCFMICSSSSQ